MTATRLVTFCRNARIADPGKKLAKMFAVYPTKGFDPHGGVFDHTELTLEKKVRFFDVFLIPSLVDGYIYVQNTFPGLHSGLYCGSVYNSAFTCLHAFPLAFRPLPLLHVLIYIIVIALL